MFFLVESIFFFNIKPSLLVRQACQIYSGEGEFVCLLLFFLVINSTPVSFVLFGVSRYGSGVVVLGVLGASLHIAAQAW